MRGWLNALAVILCYTEGRPRVLGLCVGTGDIWAAGEGGQAGRQQDEGGGQHEQAEHAGLV